MNLPDCLFQIEILSLKLSATICFLSLFFCFVRVFVASFFSIIIFIISFLVTRRLALSQFEHFCSSGCGILLFVVYFSYWLYISDLAEDFSVNF